MERKTRTTEVCLHIQSCFYDNIENAYTGRVFQQIQNVTTARLTAQPQHQGRNRICSKRCAWTCYQSRWVMVKYACFVLVVRSLLYQNSLMRKEIPLALVYSVTTTSILADSTDYSLNRLNKLLYIGQFGLGHRLSKMSAAFHLARYSLDLPSFEIQFGLCHFQNTSAIDSLDIAADLFGNSLISMRSSWNKQSIDDYGNKVVLVQNDVLGYYAGQSYKNAHYRIPVHWFEQLALESGQCDNTNKQKSGQLINNDVFPLSSSPLSLWLDKMCSDEKLYSELLRRFQQIHPEFINFQRTHAWNDSTVIGLHLRAGNGEGDHFVQAKRGVSNRFKKPYDRVDGANDDDISDNETNGTENDAVIIFVKRLVNLIVNEFVPMLNHDNRVILYLATDTASLIPVIQSYLSSLAMDQDNNVLKRSVVPKLLVFPQDRLPANHGVSYSAWTQGSQCVRGWRASMMDMALLSSCHVVIAGMRSTFTQTMPLSLVLPQQAKSENKDINNNTKNNNNKQYYRFCEVAETGRRMSCFADRITWLFRRSQPVLIKSSQTLSSPSFASLSSSTTLPVDMRHAVFASSISSKVLKNSINESDLVNLRRRHLQPVTHKVILHLPDIFEREERIKLVQSFVHIRNHSDVQPLSSPTMSSLPDRDKKDLLVYGNRFNKKYRGNEVMETDWTWDNSRQTE